MGEKKAQELKPAGLMDGTETPEEVLVKLLMQEGFTISTAESCTGGLVSTRLVSVPGVSEVFKEGFITYSNKAKRRTLDVSKSTIRKEGAVSEQTAKEMAMGAAMMADTDVAVSVTGNAGPAAEEDKPVGLVYIGIYIRGKVKAFEYHFEGDREEIRQQAATEAISVTLPSLRKLKEKKETKETKETKDSK